MRVRLTDELSFSQRIFWPAVADDQRFAQLLQLLQRQRPAVDDVWIFTEGDGQDFRYIPLPEVHRRAALMEKRIQALRDAGFVASINVLNTIGHSDYAEPFLDPLPWSGVVGPDGGISSCCSCPRQAQFRAYVRSKYTAYARCRPQWIWVDDDVRLFMHFHKAMHGCYCDDCMAEFSRRVGRPWEREEVYRAIVDNTYPLENAVRASWMHFLSEQIVELHQLIREAVHAVDSGIGLGGMNTGFHQYTAYYARFADRFEALRGNPQTVIRSRPGGGAFTDDRPVEAYQKAWSIAFQNAQYPAATERHAEVENYPFQFFEKSVASTVRETSLYLAAGCEGVAFDILGGLGNDPLEHAPYLQAIAARRPYFDELRRTLAGGIALGLNVAFHGDHAALAASDGKSLNSTDASQFFTACGWGFLGLPLRFTAKPGAPSILHGQLAKGLSKDQLREVLTHGAVMDAEALEHLWAVGLGPLVGVKVQEKFEAGVFERFTDDPLNHGYTGYTREISQGYYHGVGSTFASTGATLRPLARLYNYREAELGVCAVAVEAAAGARFVVLGYRPWDYLGLPGKMAQCRQVVAWLYREQFPMQWTGSGKAVLFGHALPSGAMAACLYNASADPLVNHTMVFRNAETQLEIVRPDLRRERIVRQPGGEFALPELPPFGEVLIRSAVQ